VRSAGKQKGLKHRFTDYFAVGKQDNTACGVMTGLGPVTHVFPFARTEKSWMAGLRRP
jgi:hypothetical protein